MAKPRDVHHDFGFPIPGTFEAMALRQLLPNKCEGNRWWRDDLWTEICAFYSRIVYRCWGAERLVLVEECIYRTLRYVGKTFTGSVKSLFFHIVAGVVGDAFEALRRNRRSGLGMDADAQEKALARRAMDGSAAVLEGLVAGETVAILLESISQTVKAPIVLCYMEGLSAEEAGEILGVPVSTVYSRLARGRAQLRRAVGKRGVVWSGRKHQLPSRERRVKQRMEFQ